MKFGAISAHAAFFFGCAIGAAVFEGIRFAVASLLGGTYG